MSQYNDNSELSDLDIDPFTDTPDFDLLTYTNLFQSHASSDAASDNNSFDGSNAHRLLSIAIDNLAFSPDQLLPDTFKVLLYLSLNFRYINDNHKSQFVDLINSSFIKIIKNSDNNNIDFILLQKYSFLLHILLYYLKESVLEKTNILANNKSNNTLKFNFNQIESILSTIILLTHNKNIFKNITSQSDLNIFINLFTNPIYSLLEFEAINKYHSIVLFIQKIIPFFITINHAQHQSFYTFLHSHLNYSTVHLSSIFSQILSILYTDYDYESISIEILSHLPINNNNTKMISSFLINLSDLIPNLLIKNLTNLLNFLNNSSITLRLATIESITNIIIHLLQSSDDDTDSNNNNNNNNEQVEKLLTLTKERFYDSNPYVRSKAIQSCNKILEIDNINNNTTYNLNNFKLLLSDTLSNESILDKSSLVRKNSIKLLSRILSDHKFVLNNSNQLNLKNWNNSLENIKNLVISSNNEEQDQPNHLPLLIKYHLDAIKFINNIQTALKTSSILLFSKNKNEILEIMNFIVLTNAFDIDDSSNAIKRMLYLVWTKSSTANPTTSNSTTAADIVEENKSIIGHLIDCYYQLFFTTPNNISSEKKATIIAKNLINLTIGLNQSDLLSLQNLLCIMYDKNLITEGIVEILWKIFSTSSLTSNKDQIYGSILILGMLSLSNTNIPLKNFNSLINIGLNSNDLILIKHTLLIFERLDNNSLNNKQEKVLIDRIFKIIINYTEETNYFPLCQQAVNTLFKIAKKPDSIIENIIKEKTMMTFSSPNVDNSMIVMDNESRIISLTQLLFIVGQTSIRILVQLENYENVIKKNISNVNTTKKDNNNTINNNNNKADELQLVNGNKTNEDDLTEAISTIKEYDLLFNKNSLLMKFSPIIENVITNFQKFENIHLQRAANLCLQKFMLISSTFCEKNLPLLITIMEKSNDPIIRSNSIIALGDITVTFNNLIDENINFLFKRINDKNLSVQKTALMTITFLILAGQIKVKGQLSELAKCLQHKDSNIKKMTKNFFMELATKDNAVYNSFIDIFSNLSNDSSVTNDDFHKIIKFLVPFIDKERYQRQLNDKLLKRLKMTDNKQTWENIAFVLNSLPFKNEETLKTLFEGFKGITKESITTNTNRLNGAPDTTTATVNNPEIDDEAEDQIMEDAPPLEEQIIVNPPELGPA